MPLIKGRQNSPVFEIYGCHKSVNALVLRNSSSTSSSSSDSGNGMIKGSSSITISTRQQRQQPTGCRCLSRNKKLPAPPPTAHFIVVSVVIVMPCHTMSSCHNYVMPYPGTVSRHSSDTQTPNATHTRHIAVSWHTTIRGAIHHCHAEVHVPYARIAATARAIGNTRALNERRLLMRAVVEELVVFHAFESNQHDALCVPYVWHACETSRGIRRDVREDRGNQVRVFGDA